MFITKTWIVSCENNFAKLRVLLCVWQFVGLVYGRWRAGPGRAWCSPCGPAAP